MNSDIQLLAEQGDSDAQYELGLQYKKNKIYDLAAHWFTKSSEQGNYKGQGELGILFLQGYGVVKNEQEAVLKLSQAAEAGHDKSQHNMATFLIKGQLVPKNLEKAFYYLKQASQNGAAPTQFYLALLYRDGLPGMVDVDIEKSLEWMMKAQENDSEIGKRQQSEVQYNIAHLYYHNPELENNKQLALEWVRKSAENGFDKSKDALAQLSVAGIEYEVLDALF